MDQDGEHKEERCDKCLKNEKRIKELEALIQSMAESVDDAAMSLVRVVTINSD
ncbi:hypothetical protein [Geitlerinema calcuttense]|uniref:Uncharacterized protein n=1 Tax=Geitlerinema calcuttense NRMC-F 0142 TaxID=2922238 RepID=A0ABT7LV58_9CYAN|nr:hypothetical protein [Geitlerinema calcuttense]MDL5055929.1 hypothetical protein [Geitlerinema calcuttense NRMC-F 0142]